jgi:lipopolysaccharide/colanic/teichoic acid biosynthesis glycosyltransferase
VGEVKRLIDITVAAIGLIVLLPFLGLVAICIMAEDAQWPMFTQERCGRGITRFRIMKFRTMKAGRHTIKDYAADSRVTVLGAKLRRFHIDELPTLVNVLLGHMSLVGPRPMPFEVDEELDPGYPDTTTIPGWHLRSTVRPGMTGLAQVRCPKMASRQEKFRHDGMYVRHRSPKMEMAILLGTVALLLRTTPEKTAGILTTLVGVLLFNVSALSLCFIPSPSVVMTVTLWLGVAYGLMEMALGLFVALRPVR